MSSIRLALASLLFSLAACFPSPQPSAPASSAAPSDDPQIVAACQQSTTTMLAECSKPLDPALSREDVRSGVDTYKQDLQLRAEHARVVCEHKDAGPASARACTAANADFAAAQDTLRAYLLERGFDARDLRVLSLSPTV